MPTRSRWTSSADCWDETGEHHGGLPTYPWGHAPTGLVTRRQLRALDLAPGGHDPVAQMLRPRRRRPTEPLTAYLYDITTAVDKRTPTERQQAAIRAMNRAHRICAACGLDAGYRIPTTSPCLGDCVDCTGAAGRIEGYQAA
ncbi:RRQRL motif-containing zinc-binding protein [Actinoalloteichus sp. GBA129-24]|uniref:RRQRL motif-containing zinc-binding protein n=1 Tax=Actinoalloteichus sp. GBA129-24 TaxID=1612551 RepID=UPI000950478C|nr:RRQRL motif-containing zinc-binding protein [Actinoalloteichus sp. GBA129-24]APU20146.1 hypothetical protein UA75_10665 [Actinoalloteichus sp. GBA129-24]